MLNTLCIPFPDRSNEEVIEVAEEAISGLHHLGLIVPCQGQAPVPPDKGWQFLVFNGIAVGMQARKHRTWDEEWADSQRLMFLLTGEGREAMTT